MKLESYLTTEERAYLAAIEAAPFPEAENAIGVSFAQAFEIVAQELVIAQRASEYTEADDDLAAFLVYRSAERLRAISAIQARAQARANGDEQREAAE